MSGLQKWEAHWLMKFNASKCSIMTVTNKKFPVVFQYQIHNTVLDRVSESKYLGVTIQATLKWYQHIGSICKKASRTLGILHRNLLVSSQEIRERAYLSLVRPQVEYSCTVWDSYQKTYINNIERFKDMWLENIWIAVTVIQC